MDIDILHMCFYRFNYLSDYIRRLSIYYYIFHPTLPVLYIRDKVKSSFSYDDKPKPKLLVYVHYTCLSSLQVLYAFGIFLPFIFVVRLGVSFSFLPSTSSSYILTTYFLLLYSSRRPSFPPSLQSHNFLKRVNDVVVIKHTIFEENNNGELLQK